MIIFFADWLVVAVYEKGHQDLWHLNPSDYLCVCVYAGGVGIEDLVYHRML